MGLSAGVAALLMVLLGLYRAVTPHPNETRRQVRLRALIGALGLMALAGFLAAPPAPRSWPLARGLGGFWGDGLLVATENLLAYAHLPFARVIAALIYAGVAAWGVGYAFGVKRSNLFALGERLVEALAQKPKPLAAEVQAPLPPARARPVRRAIEPVMDPSPADAALGIPPAPGEFVDREIIPVAIKGPKAPPRESGREQREAQGAFDFVRPGGFSLPELAMLAKPKPRAAQFDEGALRQNAQLLESVLAEFGVRGQIDQIRPGPVVTLYELVPAPGVKSARVVALSDDIARSMSVAACRVAVVAGRNAIGIELPNVRRETVYLRDLLASAEYEKSSQALPMALGKTSAASPISPTCRKCPTC